jgi:hypothetical protein
MSAEYYNPYSSLHTAAGRWLKMQLHCHNLEMRPTVVEKAEGFEEVLFEYKSAAYEIVMHSGQRDWYDTSEASTSVGIQTYNGQEYIVFDGILLVGTSSFIQGAPQRAVLECERQGGFAVICHPNQLPMMSNDVPPRPIHLDRDVALALRGAVGVEIFNGCFARRPRPSMSYGNGLATDFWDQMLSAGVKIWGFGSDDSHHRFEINVGWTYVYAPDTAFSAVKEAVVRGAVCASNGLILYDFELSGDTLMVEADLPHRRTNHVDYVVIGPEGEVFERTRAARLLHRLRGTPNYLRVEARGDDGAMLWTQPILLRSAFNL